MLSVQSDTLLVADVFRTLEKCVLKYTNLIPQNFFQLLDQHGKQLKQTKVKLDLLTDIDMLLMVERGIRGGKCHSIYGYTKANNNYMKGYDKNKESSYIQYWDVNNLYGWAMSQKLPANDFEWMKDTSQSNEEFIKNYNEESDEGHFLEVDVQYLEKLQELHNDLPFLPERMKMENVEKLVANLHDKIHISYSHNKFKASI